MVFISLVFSGILIIDCYVKYITQSTDKSEKLCVFYWSYVKQLNDCGVESFCCDQYNSWKCF